MVQSKTRKHKRKQRGGTATPHAPKKQKRTTNYNLRSNQTVRQLINIFEPITPLNIQEGNQPKNQSSNTTQQRPQPSTIIHPLRKLPRSRKNTVTQQSLQRPPKQQALITLPTHIKKNQPQSQSIFTQKKSEKLEYLTAANNKPHFNIWTEQNFAEPN